MFDTLFVNMSMNAKSLQSWEKPRFAVGIPASCLTISSLKCPVRGKKSVTKGELNGCKDSGLHFECLSTKRVSIKDEQVLLFCIAIQY
jgi:hypothetical protein